MQKYQVEQLQRDLLGSDKFWIRYVDEQGEDQDIYFWFPSPFGLCDIQVASRHSSPGLLVTTETLTQPNGPPDDPTFLERAGVPGMTSPAEYGLQTVKTWIPFARLLALRMRPATGGRVIWLLDAAGDLCSIETVKPPE